MEENLAMQLRSPTTYFDVLAVREDFPALALKNAGPTEVKGPPTRAPFWVAVGGAAAGTIIAAAGFVVGDHYTDLASYNRAKAENALREDDKSRYNSQKKTNESKALGGTITGYVGTGLAAASVGYIIYDEIVRHRKPESEVRIEGAAGLRPVVGVTPQAAFFGLGTNY